MCPHRDCSDFNATFQLTASGRERGGGTKVPLFLKEKQILNHCAQLHLETKQRQDIKDQETLDKLMEGLDADGDTECDFQEFVVFIAMVAAACHEFFVHEDE
uniref:Protein S100-B-like n=1 Tax=Callorhinchus milii TaxID=7868 RepID=A0A4W3I8B4_CALMI